MVRERQKIEVFTACTICSSCQQNDCVSFHFLHMRVTAMFTNLKQKKMFFLDVTSPVNPGEKPTALIDGTVICRSETSSKSASLSFPALPIRMLRPLIRIWSTTDGSKRMKRIYRVGRSSAQLCLTQVTVSLPSHFEYKV